MFRRVTIVSIVKLVAPASLNNSRTALTFAAQLDPQLKRLCCIHQRPRVYVSRSLILYMVVALAHGTRLDPVSYHNLRVNQRVRWSITYLCIIVAIVPRSKVDSHNGELQVAPK